MNLPTKKVLAEFRALALKKAETATLAEKALMVIDSFLAGADPNDESPFLSKLYRIAHGCSPFVTCYDAHEDWRKETAVEFEKLIQELKASETE